MCLSEWISNQMPLVGSVDSQELSRSHIVNIGVMWPSTAPPSTNSGAGNYKVISILPCRATPVSRKSSGDTGQMTVLEGDRLNLSEQTASRSRALPTGEEDRPLEGIARPALEDVGASKMGTHAHSNVSSCLHLGRDFQALQVFWHILKPKIYLRISPEP